MTPKEINAFSWRVIDQVQKLIQELGLTDAQVIRDSGMPRNTFYRKMRGETPLDTDDIAKLAIALGIAPEDLFARAARARLRALPTSNVPTAEDYLDHTDAPDLSALPIAAKRGVRKADQEPHAD